MHNQLKRLRIILSATGGAMVLIATMLTITAGTATASTVQVSNQDAVGASNGSGSYPPAGAEISDWQTWAAQQRLEWSTWAQPMLIDPAAIQFTGEYSTCTLVSFGLRTHTTSGTHGVPEGLSLPTAWAIVDCPPNAQNGVALFHIARPGKAAPWLPSSTLPRSDADQRVVRANQLGPQYTIEHCEAITGPGEDCLGSRINPSSIIDFGSYLYQGSAHTTGYVEFSYNGSPSSGCSVGSFIAGSPIITLHNSQKAVALASPGVSAYFASTWWGSNAQHNWGTVCDVF